MGELKITPSFLSGKVHIPPSKSQAHRAILCAALADGESRVQPVSDSKDMEATVRGVTALGACASAEREVLAVNGTGLFSCPDAEIDCGESGSTLRFLVPIAAAGGAEVSFIGTGRLPQRPIGAYLELLPAHGVYCESSGGLPLHIKGKLQPGDYTLAGNVSSQYITGLLLALPLLKGDSRIILASPLESKGYVDMTIDVMHSFGVTSRETEYGYCVPGNQTYQNGSYRVEGDWSQAAFFLVAGALNGAVTLTGLRQDSLQGDKAILPLLRRMGAKITQTSGGLHVCKSALHGITANVSDIPDLVPVLAVACAAAEGKSVIYGGARLRLKESDRIESTVQGLRALGVQVEETKDGMVIHGVPSFSGGTVDSYNDHRIAMAFSVAAIGSIGSVHIRGWESVRKSYPGFYSDYRALGGLADVIHMG